MTFFIELPVPLLLIQPVGVLRLCGVALTVKLMLLIVLTGNYGFFNWLTIALTFSVLDDSQLNDLFFDTQPFNTASWHDSSSIWALMGLVLCLLCGFIGISLSVAVLVPMMDLPRQEVVALPEWTRRISTLLKPLSIGKGYGLFASMTLFRHELILEATLDHDKWEEYHFRFKPGDPMACPMLVQIGHMPRLDWRIWFIPLKLARAGRDSMAIPEWFHQLLSRLLEGSDDVTALFAHVPFDGKPPVAIRVSTYDFHFTTVGNANSKVQGWWERKFLRRVMVATKFGVRIDDSLAKDD